MRAAAASSTRIAAAQLQRDGMLGRIVREQTLRIAAHDRRRDTIISV